MRADLVSFYFLNSKFQRSRHDCKPEQNRRIRDAGLEHISRGYCVGCPLTVSLAKAHFTPLASAGIAAAEACTGTVAVFLTLDYGRQHAVSLLLGVGTCGSKRFQAFLHPLQSGCLPRFRCGIVLRLHRFPPQRR